MKSGDKEYFYYHGTDARFVRMSEAERCQYKDDCNYVIDYMWPFYCHIMEEDPFLMSLYDRIPDQNMAHNVSQACLIHDSYLRGSGQYQYGDLYLTSYLKKAVSYAAGSFVGGEYARKAFRMYQGAQVLKFEGWNPDERFCEIMGTICKYESDPHEPVVFKFDNLDKNYLERDNGAELSFPDDNDWPLFNQMVRYKKPVQLDLSKAAFLHLPCSWEEIYEIVNRIEPL